MKVYKIGIVLLVFIVAVLSSYIIKTELWDKNTDDKGRANLSFYQQSYDIGLIEKTDEAHVYFKFKNIGEEELYISDILTRCGCTVPFWNKEAIKPNQEDSILVEFNPIETGLISNEVHVYVNNNPMPTILYLKGIVQD